MRVSKFLAIQLRHQLAKNQINGSVVVAERATHSRLLAQIARREDKGTRIVGRSVDSHLFLFVGANLAFLSGNRKLGVLFGARFLIQLQKLAGIKSTDWQWRYFRPSESQTKRQSHELMFGTYPRHLPHKELQDCID